MFQDSFNLCFPGVTNKTGVYLLEYWLTSAFTYLAMTNYPYKTGFLKPLPAWPANYSCTFVENVTLGSSDRELFSAIRKAVEVYYGK